MFMDKHCSFRLCCGKCITVVIKRILGRVPQSLYCVLGVKAGGCVLPFKIGEGDQGAIFSIRFIISSSTDKSQRGLFSTPKLNCQTHNKCFFAIPAIQGVDSKETEGQTLTCFYVTQQATQLHPFIDFIQSLKC